MGTKGKGRLLMLLAVALFLTVLLIPKDKASALSVEDALSDVDCVSWCEDLAGCPLQITPQPTENGRVMLDIKFNEYADGDQIISVSYDATGHVSGLGMITPDAARTGASSGVQLSLPAGALSRIYLLDKGFAPKGPGVEIWS